MRFKLSTAVLAICSLTAAALLATSPIAAADPAISVSVITGNGTVGETGDGGNATAAQITDLAGMTVDPSGRLDLFDTGERQIRRIDPSDGIIKSIVGNGTWCTDTDTAPDGQITGICPEYGLAVASNGTIYYGDGYGISQSVGGVSTHYAGATSGNHSTSDGPKDSVDIFSQGIRVSPTSNDVYYVDTDDHGIRHIDSSGNITTPIGESGNCSAITPTNGMTATGACFQVVDFGFWNDDVYFIDKDNAGVQYILLDHNNVIKIVAGNGTANETAPDGIAAKTPMPLIRSLTVAPDGSVFVAGAQRGRIWKITTDGQWQFVYEFQGGIPYLATDIDGNLYANLQSTFQIVKLTGVSTPPPPAVTPAPPSNRMLLVGLGDSVAAGEATYYGWLYNGSKWIRTGPKNPIWEQTSDISATNQDCHRTKDAYSYQIALTNNYDFINLACTGASAAHGLVGKQSFEGGVSEEAQLDVLARLNPDIITLTLGADDIHFDEFVGSCYTPGKDCDNVSNTRKLTTYLKAEKADLHSVLAKISSIASSLKKPVTLLVTDYYNPFPDTNVSCIDISAKLGIGIKPNEKAWMIDALHQLNANIRNEVKNTINTVKTLNTHLVELDSIGDISNLMLGHTWCSNSPWAYGPSIRYPSLAGGSGDSSSPAPFHPLPAAQRSIKDRSEQYLP